MNRTCPLKSCELWEILISCGLDDELTDQEQSLLTQHVQECSSCGEMQIRMEQLNQVMRGQVVQLDHRYPAVPPAPVCLPPRKPELKRPFVKPTARFLVHAALAASAVIALVLFSLAVSMSRTSDSVEIRNPLVALNRINTERIEDQRFLRDSLELDLRTLKLQVATLDSGDAATGLLNRIDDLMKKIDEFDPTGAVN